MEIKIQNADQKDFSFVDLVKSCCLRVHDVDSGSDRVNFLSGDSGGGGNIICHLSSIVYPTLRVSNDHLYSFSQLVMNYLHP